MKATVALIGRNEEKTLPRLMKSLEKFVDIGGEVIFVDTGSTDKTVDIARELEITVYETGERFYSTVSAEKEKEINEKFIIEGDKPLELAGKNFFNFADARNYSASLAKNDFVIQPDCDEIFSNLDLEALKKNIEDGAEKVYSTLICSWDKGGKPVTRLSHCRMYDRRKYRWVGRVHEVLEGEGTEVVMPIELHHKPLVAKSTEQYLGSLAIWAFDEPTNDRASHYFARELKFKRRLNSAIREFKRHINMNGWAVERSQSAVFMGECYKALNKEADAVLVWQEAFSIDATRRMPLIKLAEHYDRKGDYKRASAYALASTAIPYRQNYIDDESHYRELPYEIAFRNLWYIGKKEESKQCFDKALAFAPWKHDIVKNWKFYYPTPMVSIVIPTLGRPEKLDRLIKSIKEKAGYENYEIIIEHDSFEDRKGALVTFKEGVAKATGDFIMYLGNDCIMEQDCVMQAVIAMMKTFPEQDGLVCLNDYVYNGSKATHWMGSRKLLAKLGGEFFCTEYEHCFSDDELTHKARYLGKYVYAEHAKIFHDNAKNRGGELDEVLKIAYDSKRYHRDEATFIKRKKHNFGLNPKIILANQHLWGYTGSETWTYTMAKYLKRKYEVVVMAQQIGEMANRIKQLGIRVVSDWEPASVYMISHTANYNKIPVSERGKVIYTSHSKIYDIEKFPEMVNGFRIGVNVAISEEVAGPTGPGAPCATVIRQPIDLERFVKKPINKKLTNILYLSHPAYSGGQEIIRKACEGYNLIIIDKPIFDIETLIYQADLAIAVGRGALEALACGRNVILADHRKGQTKTLVGGGMVTEDNFKSFYKTNFTGRESMVQFTAEGLREEFGKYDSSRVIDVSELNASKIVEQYEELFARLSL